MHDPKSDGAPPEHVITVVAAPGDIDELGHVSNVVYVRWLQDAAKAHSEAAGWDRRAYLEKGAVFVVRRHEIDYLASSFAGDELVIHTHVASFGAATCERMTRIVRPRDGAVLARSLTLWAFVSTTTHRPKRIPQEIRDAFLPPAPAVSAGA
jgi:acyl-CoA thioester hydrolase